MKLKKSERLAVAFWLPLISLFLSFVSGFITSYGFRRNIIGLIYQGVGLFHLSTLLVSIGISTGFVTIAEIFKKRFLRYSSYLYCGVFAYYFGFSFGSLVYFPKTGLNPFYVTPTPFFLSPPRWVIILVNIGVFIFGLALFSLRDVFKFLAPITSILTLLLSLTFLPLTLTFLIFISGIVRDIFLLIMIYKSRKFLKRGE